LLSLVVSALFGWLFCRPRRWLVRLGKKLRRLVTAEGCLIMGDWASYEVWRAKRNCGNCWNKKKQAIREWMDGVAESFWDLYGGLSLRCAVWNTPREQEAQFEKVHFNF